MWRRHCRSCSPPPSVLWSTARGCSSRMHTAPSDIEPVSPTQTPSGTARAGRVLPQVAAALVVVLLLLVIVRLPWAGDLGMHAATIQRLSHNLLHPGNPLVDAD